MIDALKNVPLLAVFSDEQLTALSSFITIESFSRNQVVFNEGDPGDSLYVIGSGEIEIQPVDEHLSVAFQLQPREREDRLALSLCVTAQFRGALLPRCALVQRRVRAGEAGLLLGGAGLGLSTQPFEFASQEVLTVAFSAGCLGFALGLGLEVERVAARIAAQRTLVKLQRSCGDTVEHGAVVGDEQ